MRTWTIKKGSDPGGGDCSFSGNYHRAVRSTAASAQGDTGRDRRNGKHADMVQRGTGRVCRIRDEGRSGSDGRNNSGEKQTAERGQQEDETLTEHPDSKLPAGKGKEVRVPSRRATSGR